MKKIVVISSLFFIGCIGNTSSRARQQIEKFLFENMDNTDGYEFVKIEIDSIFDFDYIAYQRMADSLAAIEAGTIPSDRAEQIEKEVTPPPVTLQKNDILNYACLFKYRTINSKDGKTMEKALFILDENFKVKYARRIFYDGEEVFYKDFNNQYEYNEYESLFKSIKTF